MKKACTVVVGGSLHVQERQQQEAKRTDVCQSQLACRQQRNELTCAAVAVTSTTSASATDSRILLELNHKICSDKDPTQ